jgi:hypothetical protein
MAYKLYLPIEAQIGPRGIVGQTIAWCGLPTRAEVSNAPALSGDVTGSQANPRARIGAGFLTDPSLFNHVGQGITLSQLITDSGRTSNLVAQAIGARRGLVLFRFRHNTRSEV